ncbi:MAG: Smr/MutS family protein [Gallionella sp.]|nr:Smr/MutS family protein [Gallionella sp.]MDD4959323.1 Smr/MutS family protein [Gallionella sp.]
MAADYEDDYALFRAAVGDVKKLPPYHRVEHPKPPCVPFRARHPAPLALPDVLSDLSASEVPSEFLRNGYSRQKLRKLRRTLAIQDHLDLHGYLSDAARKQLQQFLHDALHQGLRCVLVIHGKGLNSRDGEAVLKLRTRHWLMQHPAVLAYCDAPLNEGGSGAVWVLLRASARAVDAF